MKNVTKKVQILMLLLLSVFVFTYQGKAQTTLLTEGWETATNNSNVPPAGWGLDVILGSNITYYYSTGTWPTIAPFEGARLVDFLSFSYTSGTNRLKRVTPISTVGYNNITVDFEWYTDNGYAGTTLEGVIIQWSTNGTVWTDAGTTWMRYSPTNQWVLNTQALPVGAEGQATLYVAFRFNSQYGDDCHMDISHVKGLQTGTLAGTVTNCVGGAPLSGVLVSVGTPAITGNTNAAGQYTIAGVPTGIQNVSATFAGFSPYGPTPVGINANQTTTLNFCMSPLPAYVNGVITNACTGAPVIGAKVAQATLLTNFVLSTGPTGAYSLPIYPATNTGLTISKDGFANFSVPATLYTPPTVYNNVNVALVEKANAPGTATAALNTGGTAAIINWGCPSGNYLLLYDDGTQENFAIWASAGNLDAVKFTPSTFPATVLGCMINIGKSTNYSGTGQPVTFKVGIFDATGPGGAPGNQIGTYVDFVVPATTYGWIDAPAEFGAGTVINSGSFYIVTKQVGAYPNAAGIAVDTTTTALRSYQKFGTSPWVVTSGNFMIRAHMYGCGTATMAANLKQELLTGSAVEGVIYTTKPGTVTGYESTGNIYPDSPTGTEGLVGFQVWRFLQGQEGTPASWVSIGTPTGNTITDNSWPSLPCQSYR